MWNMNFRGARATGVSVLALVAYIATAARTDFKPPHAILGSWTFMREHSTFEPGPAPYQSMTLNFSVTENGLRNDVDGVDAQGHPIHASYLIVTDGNDHPVTGTRAFDSSSYTRVSESTTVYVRQKRGATVVVGSRVLSRDGKILIFKEKKVDDFGRQRGKAFLVFERL